MLTMQNIESELSYAYLHTIASRAGFICSITDRHTDATGIDVVLRYMGKKLAEESILTKFVVEVQLKATQKKPVERKGKYSYSLSIKNYDELRDTHVQAPKILILYYLPQDQGTWVEHSEEQLITRRCAYWLSLYGAPEVGQESKTVSIPKTNVLSVETLYQLMTRFSKEEVIEYEN